jgi:DNA invertase Pin-like site-specific DNA recombinase
MRISTSEERSKQKFDRQEKSIEKYCSDNNIDILLSFKDDCSGKDFNRPNWIKLEKLLQKGDTIILKDISRFIRNTELGYNKYMELLNKGINITFLDNPTVSTDYIKNMMKVAADMETIVKTTLEFTVKLLITVELDRVEKERTTFIKRIKDGIQASEKKSGRKEGNLDKMSDALREDIKDFINDRSIKQVDLINKHNISRNTLKKYI